MQFAWVLLFVVFPPGIHALVALPTMKFYARTLPLSQLFLIAFWASFRVFLIGGLVMFLLMLSVRAPGALLTVWWLNAINGLVLLSGIGALISRSLKRKGFALPFPGIGARAMAGIGIIWGLWSAAYQFV